MNSVLSVSTPVYVLIRRIVNVFSVLSISDQYLGSLLKFRANGVDRKVDSIPERERGVQASSSHESRNENGEPDKDASDIPKLNPIPGPERPPERGEPKRLDTIHQLLQNPVLYDPIRTPRNPIALCHGLYGFDVRGPSAFPSLQMHYWSNVLQILKKVGAEIIVTSVPATGTIASRAGELDKALKERAPGKGINFLAHSMGGLDCRHLITHIKPKEYTPVSLTTVATPHRGSPFMDWCTERIGIGRLAHEEGKRSKAEESTPSTEPDPSSAAKNHERPPYFPSPPSIPSFPSSFTTYLLSILDSPAYANLSCTYLNDVFNPTTPDDSRVKYFSVAARIPSVPVWHPFWLPKMVLDGVESGERARLRKEGEQMLKERGWTREDYIRAEGRPPVWEREDEWGNDGLVTVQSARWGEFLGIMEGCDHWEIRGARGLELDIDLPNVPFGIRNSFGEGWNLSDWTRFVTAWRKEERKKESEKEKGDGKRERTEKKDKEDTLSKAVKAGEKGKARREQGKDSEHDDAFLKLSTEKLSAVVDWIVEQVPTPAKSGISPLASSSRGKSASPDEKSAKEQSRKSKKPVVKNELETKEDLERFYVALARKLYDEGL
ncbi:alpha/beta-hydrolase [Neolentinus lepideus HHB14362 ss-1]|uniref:Alpha/beta-hydrolase n=1 Tax=Neolentinus lepideus HHB14362 ss-1 TaxID=1314782 RepID=A0A165UV31_9AGAM|nr:alpha/beta-hydrolase [Neolentinus lepideus HHB14362 ss-1]